MKLVDFFILTHVAFSECAQNEFKCVNIPKCVTKDTVCNKINDCGDWSDERDCSKFNIVFLIVVVFVLFKNFIIYTVRFIQSYCFICP